jgi:hypothetical protein
MCFKKYLKYVCEIDIEVYKSCVILGKMATTYGLINVYYLRTTKDAKCFSLNNVADMCRNNEYSITYIN